MAKVIGPNPDSATWLGIGLAWDGAPNVTMDAAVAGTAPHTPGDAAADPEEDEVVVCATEDG